ncbi:hypothetical protein EDB85DRAFT_1893531 [Lactarius pseudohatsudake]|nr:hypothetical protein EDB85DRAFT_1893531 [Lactarius pseudohatsudake]
MGPRRGFVVVMWVATLVGGFAAIAIVVIQLYAKGCGHGVSNSSAVGANQMMPRFPYPVIASVAIFAICGPAWGADNTGSPSHVHQYHQSIPPVAMTARQRATATATPWSIRCNDDHNNTLDDLTTMTPVSMQPQPTTMTGQMPIDHDNRAMPVNYDNGAMPINLCWQGDLDGKDLIHVQYK